MQAEQDRLADKREAETKRFREVDAMAERGKAQS